MKVRRAIGVISLAGFTALGLSGCSLATPLAYLVRDDVIDVAFCDTFRAASVEIVFSEYPGPFQGPKHTVDASTGSGPATRFGAGIPVSASTRNWTFDDDGRAPEEWDRVDYTFYDERGTHVDSQFFFSSEIESSEWTWQHGSGFSDPDCEVETRRRSDNAPPSDG